MNKKKLLILLLLSFLLAEINLPAYAGQRLPKRFSLILQYKIAGNLTESANIICQYSFRRTNVRDIYKAIDCEGEKFNVVVEKTGRNVFIGIPLFLDSAIFAGFNVFISEKNVGFPCKGTLQPGGFISGTCSATTNLSGILFALTGSFTATPG